MLKVKADYVPWKLKWRKPNIYGLYFILYLYYIYHIFFFVFLFFQIDRIYILIIPNPNYWKYVHIFFLLSRPSSHAFSTHSQYPSHLCRQSYHFWVWCWVIHAIDHWLHCHVYVQMYAKLFYVVIVSMMIKVRTLLGNKGRVVGNYLHVVHVWEDMGYHIGTLI